MSSKIVTVDDFAQRIARAADHQRMVFARREVVTAVRALVLGQVLPANDITPATPIG